MITSSTWSHSTLHTHIEMVCSSYSFFNYISTKTKTKTKTKRTLFSTHPWNCWLCHSWQYCQLCLDHTNCPAWVLQSLHVVVSTWSHWAAPLGVFKGHQTSFLWWETDRKLPSSSLVTNHIASHRPANTRFYNGLWRTHTRASNEPPRSLKLYKLRILSCALMKGLASMILIRDSYCDDTDNQMLSLNDVMM